MDLEARAPHAAGLPAGLESLNLTIVHSLFQFIEQQSPFFCDIVHDETASLEPIFRYFFDLYAQGPPRRFVMKDGRATVTGYNKIGGLTFATSAKQPLIRAADFALNAIRTFAGLALRDEPIPQSITGGALPHLGAIWCGVLAAMYPDQLEQMPSLGTVMASKQWISKVFRRFHIEAQKLMEAR
jgi:hypothetical protein